MKNYFLAAAIALACGSVLADTNWEYITYSTTGTKFYVDTGSIQRPQADIVLVWMKTIPLTNVKQGTADEYDSTFSQIKIDCAQRTHQTIFLTTYLKGNVVGADDGAAGRIAQIVPGSIVDRVYNYLCTKPVSPTNGWNHT